MSKIPDKLEKQDEELFSKAVSDIKPLTQDKIISSYRTNSTFVRQKNFVETDEFIDELSDDYYPFEDEQQKNDLNYHHHSISKKQFVKFRQQSFTPELILDLHGYNRQQARHELLAFLHFCHLREYRQLSIMPGQGHGILRQSLNIWLRQLPQILAFSESPQSSGGKGVIRILIKSC